jgi:hypothetical protein
MTVLCQFPIQDLQGSGDILRWEGGACIGMPFLPFRLLCCFLWFERYLVVEEEKGGRLLRQVHEADDKHVVLGVSRVEEGGIGHGRMT